MTLVSQVGTVLSSRPCWILLYTAPPQESDPAQHETQYPGYARQLVGTQARPWTPLEDGSLSITAEFPLCCETTITHYGILLDGTTTLVDSGVLTPPMPIGPGAIPLITLDSPSYEKVRRRQGWLLLYTAAPQAADPAQHEAAYPGYARQLRGTPTQPWELLEDGSAPITAVFPLCCETTITHYGILLDGTSTLTYSGVLTPPMPIGLNAIPVITLHLGGTERSLPQEGPEVNYVPIEVDYTTLMDADATLEESLALIAQIRARRAGGVAQ